MLIYIGLYVHLYVYLYLYSYLQIQFGEKIISLILEREQDMDILWNSGIRGTWDNSE